MSHARYKCKYCGITGHGKDIPGRSIFLDNVEAAQLQSFLSVDKEIHGNGLPYINISRLTFPDAPIIEGVRELLNILRLADEHDILEQVICNHNFEKVEKDG